jgi:hypothetical protein
MTLKFLCLGTACGTFMIAADTGQPLPAAWAGGVDQCSVYLSLMSMSTRVCLVWL